RDYPSRLANTLAKSLGFEAPKQVEKPDKAKKPAE
ncbi:MAG: hypothetical protein JWO08_3359, partial [Verrucomicrobiaceae bacterium]|nr:hypothetical protein [Verrucomicrobiaceae bacterium]